jgi:hypothetical protein
MNPFYCSSLANPAASYGECARPVESRLRRVRVAEFYRASWSIFKDLHLWDPCKTQLVSPNNIYGYCHNSGQGQQEKAIGEIKENEVTYTKTKAVNSGSAEGPIDA